jgi:hypothetical protein
VSRVPPARRRRRRRARASAAAVRQVAEREAEELAKLARRRAAQHGPGGDHDRQLAGLDAELSEQVLHGRVAVGVDPLMWDACALEELADASGLG